METVSKLSLLVLVLNTQTFTTQPHTHTHCSPNPNPPPRPHDLFSSVFTEEGMLVCVCVCIFTSSSCLCTHETRTSERFVPFCFVFQSRLHHNSRLLQADCDSDQQFPDKATAPAALRVYELLMPLFIKLRGTIYHIGSHGLQFYI